MVIAEADSPKQAGKLYDEGAGYVILPHFIGGEKIERLRAQVRLRKSDFKRIREQHIRYLKKQHGIERRVRTRRKSADRSLKVWPASDGPRPKNLTS